MWLDKNGKDILLGKDFLVMGILNVTEDSFYEESRVKTVSDITERAGMMVESGADILDVGGESTRPGALAVSLDEELDRVIPAVKKIRKRFNDVLISVDTYKSEVARVALENGADIVNDISGFMFDENMASVCAKAKCPVVLMHIKGTPRNMQEMAEYGNVVDEVEEYFSKRVLYACEMGVLRERIMLDPGIGFGKKKNHNLKLIKATNYFKQRLNLPILIGASRKRVVGEITGNTEAKNRLFGSLGIHAASVTLGANVVRVHDVKETIDSCRTAFAVYNA